MKMWNCYEFQRVNSGVNCILAVDTPPLGLWVSTWSSDLGSRLALCPSSELQWLGKSMIKTRPSQNLRKLVCQGVSSYSLKALINKLYQSDRLWSFKGCGILPIGDSRAPLFFTSLIKSPCLDCRWDWIYVQKWKLIQSVTFKMNNENIFLVKKKSSGFFSQKCILCWSLASSFSKVC